MKDPGACFTENEETFMALIQIGLNNTRHLDEGRSNRNVTIPQDGVIIECLKSNSNGQPRIETSADIYEGESYLQKNVKISNQNQRTESNVILLRRNASQERRQNYFQHVRVSHGKHLRTIRKGNPENDLTYNVNILDKESSKKKDNIRKESKLIQNKRANPNFRADFFPRESRLERHVVFFRKNINSRESRYPSVSLNERDILASPRSVKAISPREEALRQSRLERKDVKYGNIRETIRNSRNNHLHRRNSITNRESLIIRRKTLTIREARDDNQMRITSVERRNLRRVDNPMFIEKKSRIELNYRRNIFPNKDSLTESRKIQRESLVSSRSVWENHNAISVIRRNAADNMKSSNRVKSVRHRLQSNSQRTRNEDSLEWNESKNGRSFFRKVSINERVTRSNSRRITKYRNDAIRLTNKVFNVDTRILHNDNRNRDTSSIKCKKYVQNASGFRRNSNILPNRNVLSQEIGNSLVRDFNTKNNMDYYIRTYDFQTTNLLSTYQLQRVVSTIPQTKNIHRRDFRVFPSMRLETRTRMKLTLSREEKENLDNSNILYRYIETFVPIHKYSSVRNIRKSLTREVRRHVPENVRSEKTFLLNRRESSFFDNFKPVHTSLLNYINMMKKSRKEISFEITQNTFTSKSSRRNSANSFPYIERREVSSENRRNPKIFNRVSEDRRKSRILLNTNRRVSSRRDVYISESQSRESLFRKSGEGIVRRAGFQRRIRSLNRSNVQTSPREVVDSRKVYRNVRVSSFERREIRKNSNDDLQRSETFVYDFNLNNPAYIYRRQNIRSRSTFVYNINNLAYTHRRQDTKSVRTLALTRESPMERFVADDSSSSRREVRKNSNSQLPIGKLKQIERKYNSRNEAYSRKVSVFNFNHNSFEPMNFFSRINRGFTNNMIGEETWYKSDLNNYWVFLVIGYLFILAQSNYQRKDSDLYWIFRPASSFKSKTNTSVFETLSMGILTF